MCPEPTRQTQEGGKRSEIGLIWFDRSGMKNDGRAAAIEMAEVDLGVKLGQSPVGGRLSQLLL